MQRGLAVSFMRTTGKRERAARMTRWCNSCTMMSRNCSVCGKAGMGTTTKAGGLTPSCAPRQGACVIEFPGRCTCAKQGKDPSRQDGRRPTKGNQGSPTSARGGLRRSTGHTQGRSCTPRRRRWRHRKSCCQRLPRANRERKSRGTC